MIHKILLSVVIPTYRRLGPLRRHLESLTKMLDRDLVTWEVIVVNNDKRTDLKRIIRKFNTILPLSVINENHIGASYARNHGIRKALGEWVAFLDDDVTVSPFWLQAVAAAITKYPNDSFLGGRIIGLLPPQIPSWYTHKKVPFWLDGVLVHYDLGAKDLAYNRNKMIPFYSANLLVRKKWLKKYGSFNIKYGPTRRGRIYVGEDTDLMRRLVQAGVKGHYLAQAAVFHHNARGCLNNSSIINHYKKNGMAQAVYANAEIRNITDKKFLEFIVLPALTGMADYYQRFLSLRRTDREKSLWAQSKYLKKREYLRQCRKIRTDPWFEPILDHHFNSLEEIYRSIGRSRAYLITHRLKNMSSSSFRKNILIRTIKKLERFKTGYDQLKHFQPEKARWLKGRFIKNQSFLTESLKHWIKTKRIRIKSSSNHVGSNSEGQYQKL